MSRRLILRCACPHHVCTGVVYERDAYCVECAGHVRVEQVDGSYEWMCVPAAQAVARRWLEDTLVARGPKCAQ